MTSTLTIKVDWFTDTRKSKMKSWMKKFKRSRKNKLKIISVSSSMNQGCDSSLEKINENSEKLKSGTKLLWSKFSITNGKMPMVKSLQFYHLLTISQMSGLSLSTLVINIVCNILCSNPENIETEKAFKVTFKNSVNGKIRNTSSLKRM